MISNYVSRAIGSKDTLPQKIRGQYSIIIKLEPTSVSRYLFTDYFMNSNLLLRKKRAIQYQLTLQSSRLLNFHKYTQKIRSEARFSPLPLKIFSVMTSSSDESECRPVQYTVKQFSYYGECIMHLKGKAAWDFVQQEWGGSMESLTPIESEEKAIEEWQKMCLPLVKTQKNKKKKNPSDKKSSSVKKKDRFLRPLPSIAPLKPLLNRRKYAQVKKIVLGDLKKYISTHPKDSLVH